MKKNLPKKFSPLLALVLVVLALFFGIPLGGDDTPATLPQDNIISTTPADTSPADTTPTDTSPADTSIPTETTLPIQTEAPIDPDGSYTTKEDVALYIHTYGCLPKNFITKNEARDLGWDGGSVEKYAEGCAIGGDKFGNREGLLPRAEGRQYYECDIDTNGQKSRGAKRIVFSNDGLIYYTEDHYESFTLLYGEE